MELKEKVIDGITVQVLPLPFFKALKLKREILKIGSPALSEFMSAIDSDGVENVLDNKDSEQNFNLSKMGKAIEILVADLTEETYMRLVKMIFESVTINNQDAGKEEIINTVYSGKMMAFYKTVAFILEANYSDFLGKDGILMGMFKKKVK